MLAKITADLIYGPLETPALTIHTSEQSQALDFVRFQNCAMNLFFKNSTLANQISGHMGYVGSICKELKNGYRHDIFHDNWHSNPAEYDDSHKHIVRNDEKALSPENVRCTLDFLESLSLLNGDFISLGETDKNSIERQYLAFYSQEQASGMVPSADTWEGIMLPFAYLTYECLYFLAYRYLKPYLLENGLDERSAKNAMRVFSSLLLLLMVLDIPTLGIHLLLMHSISMVLEQYTSCQMAQTLGNIVGTASSMLTTGSPIFASYSLLLISMCSVLRLRLSLNDLQTPVISEIIKPDKDAENLSLTLDKKIR